jgi:threonine 3-dehydrogenase
LHKLSVFAPSTIAVFGPDTPKDATPNSTIMRPTTIYGTTKVYLELLGEYYHRKFNVDFRSLRYPGIISAESPPGGGTTDYAVEIFYDVLRGKEYNCFLRDDSALPMMYMTDCLKATIDIMEASPAQLKSRVYNVTGCSFTPKEIAAAIQKHEPNFKIKYAPDFRQAIADSWPKSIDDSQAKKDWNWKPEYDLDKMVSKMLTRLRELQKSGAIKL